MTPMSERIYAKGALTDVKLWQATSFDDKRPTPAEVIAKLPTAAELEAMQSRARDEAYKAGQTQARAETERLAALAKAFGGALEESQAQLAESLLTLAIDIARQMVRESVAVRPELIIPLVRESIQSLAESHQRNNLHVCAADAELLTERLGDELERNGWKIISDDRIEAGGCRIHSSNGEVDATLAERWKQIMLTLGRSDAWLV